MACCGDGHSCVTPCPSQFDAVPCDDETAAELTTGTESVAVDCPNMWETRKIYRVARSDENCQGGLIAKVPTANKTPSSHIGCGSKVWYTGSQYISFSTSKDVCLNKYWPGARTGSRLVVVDIDEQVIGKTDCKIIDFTQPQNVQKYLSHNPWAKNFATSDCEVLLDCGTDRVRCNTILGPKTNEETEETESQPRMNRQDL